MIVTGLSLRSSQKVGFDQTLQPLTGQDALSTQAWQFTRQAAPEGHDLSRTYLAHHELESIIIITIT